MEKDKKKKAMIVLPTYNEKENIQELTHKILSLPLNFELWILVVDDNSPDGTGDIVQALAERERRIQLLVRKKRRGRGAAVIDGFKEALRLKADFVIEMDADFSHQPQFIPPLLKHCEKYDLVIGSRFIKGGKDQGRTILRKFITLLAINFVRSQLKLPVKDVNSGFRCFKRNVLEKIDLDDLISVGPSIVQEMLYKSFLMNFRIKEVPIIFIDRRKGKTKLNLLTLIETLIMVLKFKKRYSRDNLRESA